MKISSAQFTEYYKAKGATEDAHFAKKMIGRFQLLMAKGFHWL